MKGEILRNGKRCGKLLFDYLPCVNYTMLRNGVATCIQCVVENEDTTDWRQVRVGVRGEQIKPHEVMLDFIPQGQRIQLDNLKIEPELNALVNSTESIQTKFTVSVSVADEEVLQEEYDISLLPFDIYTLLYKPLLPMKAT